MLFDLKNTENNTQTAKIYLHDSRKINPYMSDNSCSICITSPPYLNNLDYGEVSKVHSHFYEITNNWNDITKRIRKKLVTSSTTHYNNNNFDLKAWEKEFKPKISKRILKELILKYYDIKKCSNKRAGKKSFHILMLLYFKDMYSVLEEIQKGSR